MVGVVFSPAARRWERKSVLGIFLKKMYQFFLLVVLAVMGVIPAVRAHFFQEPMEVNIILCTAGILLTIISLAAIGILALRRLGKH